MKRLALLLTIVLLALTPRALAAPQAASQDGSHAAAPIASVKEGVPTAITALVVFVIVMAVLSTMVWPKITKGLSDRNAKIQSEIAAAEQARKQAKDALNEYERNLAEARAEAQKMLEATRAQQNAMAAELKAKADADLNAMREKAKADIEAAKKQALAEIYSESVLVATAMAGKILQREVSAGDQQRLMDESLAELKAANA